MLFDTFIQCKLFIQMQIHLSQQLKFHKLALLNIKGFHKCNIYSMYVWMYIEKNIMNIYILHSIEYIYCASYKKNINLNKIYYFFYFVLENKDVKC